MRLGLNTTVFRVHGHKRETKIWKWVEQGCNLTLNIITLCTVGFNGVKEKFYVVSKWTKNWKINL